MKRFVMTIFASLVVGCPGQTEDPGYAYFPPPEPSPAADRTDLRMTADPSGRWVIAPAATAARHRLVLVDRKTRPMRSFDDLAEVRTASFWNAERGHGIDVVSRLVVGDTVVLSIVSYDLDANTIVFRRDLHDIGDGARLEIVPIDDTLLVRSGTSLVAIDTRTGANIGAFDAVGASISSMTLVPATESIVVSTTAGPVVLRAHDASPRCRFAEGASSDAVAVGSLAFMAPQQGGAPSQIAVIDTSRCGSAALLQAGPKIVAVDGGVATVVGRSLQIVDAATLTPSIVALEDDVVDLAASADGKKVVTFEDHDVRVIDVATRTVSARIALEHPHYLATSPDGRWMYAGSDAPGAPAIAAIDMTAAAVSTFAFAAPAVEAVAPVNFDGVVVACPDNVLCFPNGIALIDRASGAQTWIAP